MRLLAAVSGTTVQYNFSLYNTALYCTVNTAIWLADASWNENIIQIVDGEESNTENIGRRNSCIGRGVAESNTAFLRPIFSVLDDSPSTNCYILIPLHTRRPKLLRQAVRHFDKNNDCSLEARSGVVNVFGPKCSFSAKFVGGGKLRMGLTKWYYILGATGHVESDGLPFLRQSVRPKT